jgi:hypothetical protein
MAERFRAMYCSSDSAQELRQSIDCFVESILQMYSCLQQLGNTNLYDQMIRILIDKNTLLLIPQHLTSSEEEIDQMVSQLKLRILRFMELLHSHNHQVAASSHQDGVYHPLFVTIALSSEDHYTPSVQVDQLKEKVLTMVNDLLGGAKSKVDDTSPIFSHLVLHDVREEPIEMAYSLNLKAKADKNSRKRSFED